MKKWALSLVALCCASSWAQTALIHNVQGYSVHEGKLHTFSAVKFTDDKIDAVYPTPPNLATVNDMLVIDGKGKTLLPGLIDAHGHVLSYGQSLLRVDLVAASSESESVKRAETFLKQQSTTGWLLGRGWNQELWDSKAFPSKQSLDKVFGHTPVAFGRIDGHALWVNSKTLQLAGITATTKAPVGGEIIKDSQGQPTGVLIDNAMNLVYDVMPAMTSMQMQTTLVAAMESLASYGLTSVHDAGVSIDNINAYQTLAQAKAMPIRINAMLSVEDPQYADYLAKGPIKTADDMFKMDSVKISADGALGSRGASLLADYSDQHGHKGLMLYSTDRLAALILESMQAGFQVNTHAIGDNANKVVLDNYQAAIAASDTKALRHRVEHAQILEVSDIHRFAELGVIASIQATHATSDKNMAEKRLGKTRLAGAYAWRKLLNANAKIANGSDFPVESPNPYFGLHASVTRQDHDNQPLDGWLSSEKLTREEALDSFTLSAAYAGHQENLLGSIEVGKKADFILVSDDYFSVKPEDIWRSRVLKTWVDGRLVYQADE
ncbi:MULTISPECIES: amidohydrolase [Pseudomonadati]|uniref:Amidohydrolase n=1 Tax=Shewanella aestuarii TaxID=1028752 RepID=A0ABT0KYD1_9GAMM|nr:amidohydrolase [Shewanella aestuarii]MCL1116474.1 amidohydrolase [Shewanella aestuarii]GGN71689.1 amidohydrolase [Shewanella aestuarii]